MRLGVLRLISLGTVQCTSVPHKLRVHCTSVSALYIGQSTVQCTAASAPPPFRPYALYICTYDWMLHWMQHCPSVSALHTGRSTESVQHIYLSPAHLHCALFIAHWTLHIRLGIVHPSALYIGRISTAALVSTLYQYACCLCTNASVSSRSPQHMSLYAAHMPLYVCLCTMYSSTARRPAARGPPDCSEAHLWPWSPGVWRHVAWPLGD